MSDISPKKYYKVAILLFYGADILDFTGPVEVLSHLSHNRNPDYPDRMFQFTTIGRTPTIRAARFLGIQSDMLVDEARTKMADFDMLVVPGGPPAILQPLIESNAPELDLIRSFVAASHSQGQEQEQGQGQEKTLFSVCTGAFLLGAAGVLSGMTVTTHHRGLEVLRGICSKVNAAPTEIVHKRYVDGGLIEGSNVRLVTAGGISSGLDATFYIIRGLTSPDMAAFVSRVMEYQWREPEA